MQQDAWKLKSVALESETSLSGTERSTKEVEQKKKAVAILERAREGDRAEGQVLTPKAKKLEDKAARIERLKSGFRICKPQGSFLWPNMAMPQLVVHVDDLLVVPTPPSVSSSYAPRPHPLPAPSQQHESPASPVKPLAEIRPVTEQSPPAAPLDSTAITINTSAAKNSLINLNEVPSNQNEDGILSMSGSQSHCHVSASPLTYQRRLHNVITITTSPRAKKELNLSQSEEGVTEDMKSTCCSTGVGTWLALAAPPNSSMNNNCKRG